MKSRQRTAGRASMEAGVPQSPSVATDRRWSGALPPAIMHMSSLCVLKKEHGRKNVPYDAELESSTILVAGGSFKLLSEIDSRASAVLSAL